MTGNVAQDILFIIASLRSKNLPIIRDIVILNKEFPDEELAQQISGFLKIYFVQVSPKVAHVLTSI